MRGFHKYTKLAILPSQVLPPASEGWEKALFSVCQFTLRRKWGASSCRQWGRPHPRLEWGSAGWGYPHWQDGGTSPSAGWGTPYPGPRSWQGSTPNWNSKACISYTRQAVCLLRSRRRTFLFLIDFCRINVVEYFCTKWISKPTISCARDRNSTTVPGRHS